MPITDILILSFFVLCFVGLAAVLAWGDYQTHDIAKATRALALAGVGSAPPEPEMTPNIVVRKIEEKKPERVPVHA